MDPEENASRIAITLIDIASRLGTMLLDISATFGVLWPNPVENRPIKIDNCRYWLVMSALVPP
jgi:hypothetical protein